MSVDPMLVGYLAGEGNGGVFNSKNLNLYAYTYQNPINLVDPNGMLTSDDGALISEHIYGNIDRLPGNIKQVTNEKELNSYGLSNSVLNNSETGFQSAVYKNSDTNEVICAFRGTEEGSDWTNGNLPQGLGNKSSQYDQALTNAKSFASAIKGKDTAFADHSLGGGLAAASSMATGIEAKTYKAAGVHKNTVGGSSNAIDNYFVRGELLSALQEILGVPSAAGKQHQLIPAPATGFFEKSTATGALNRSLRLHGISEVIDAMGNK